MSAPAHDVWLARFEPEKTAEADLQIGLLLGEHGRPPEPLPFNPAKVERLWLTSALSVHEISVNGPQISLGEHGNGPQTVAYIGKPAASILPAAKFDDYLREEHLQSILVHREKTARETAADSSSTVSERYSRSLKLLLTDTGQPLVDCPVGLPLELSVVSADDTEVVLKATFRGQPLASAWIDRGAADGSTLSEGVTDANGRVSLPRSDGDWVVRTTHMVEDDETGADWRSWWASSAFRLSAAGVGACAVPGSVPVG